MRTAHIYSLLLGGIMACGLWGCASQPASPPESSTPSPTSTVPAGVKEVSRFGNHQDKAGDKSKDNAVALSSASESPATRADQQNKPKDASDEQGNELAAGPSSAPSAVPEDQSVSSESGESQRSAGNADDPSANLQTMSSTAITARGENPWSLEAQKVVYDDAKKRVRVSRIVWTLLDEQNQPRLVVRGNAADVNIESQNVAFDGAVTAEGSKGEKLTVNHLVWDSQKKKILGSHGVRVVRQGTVMTGDNLIASPDLKQVEVSGNVKVLFTEAPHQDDIFSLGQGM